MPEETKPPRPIWVKVGLLGLSSRGSALSFFWLTIGLSAAGFISGFWKPKMFFGIFFLVAAWWYSACIRWVDQHSEWPKA
jgi:hypothetical protein